MHDPRRFVSEIAELGKIDYFLDQLARAVERGEVHRSSYDILAPRYLERRAELVAIITGQHRAAVTVPPVSRTRPTSEYAGAVPVTGGNAATVPASTDVGIPVRGAARRGPSRQVAWTTVLLFLGAFLVIVASAIFAVTVWDLLGVTGKLAFLVTLTAGFYATGFWARTRLETPVGGLVLTAIGSALLLFDGWIVIDGYELEGLLPWAVLLLFCSVVYWYTEVRLAGRFFGVIGAASQLGWWWLLGAGLGYPVPVRLAGMAVVALAWQLAAERGEDSPSLRSLSQVLLVAAPVVHVLLALGLIADLLLVSSAGPTEVIAAAVVSLTAAITFMRSKLLPDLHDAPAALIQLPVFFAAAIAVATTGHSWWIVGTLAVAAVTYDSLAITRSGASFAIVGLAAELFLVIEACLVLDASPEVTLAVVAALAAFWALTPRLVDGAADGFGRGARETALVAQIGSIMVLAAVSLFTPVVQQAVALADMPVSGEDAALAGVVLLAWVAAASAAGHWAAWAGASVFSFYAAASVLAWLQPDRDPGFYAIALVLVAAAWLAASRLFERARTDMLAPIMRWAVRASIVPIVLVGCALEQLRAAGPGSGTFADFATPLCAALIVVAAGVYAVDAWWGRSVLTAGIAATFGVVSAGAVASAVIAPVAGATPSELLLAQATLPVVVGASMGVAALLLSGSAWAASTRTGVGAPGLFDGPTVVSVSAAVTGSLGVIAVQGPDGGPMALGMALVSGAWVLSAVIATPWLGLAAGGTGLIAVGETLRWLDVPAWVTLVVFAVLGFALAVPSLASRSAVNPRRRVAFDVLAITGLLAHGWLILVGLQSRSYFSASLDEWWEIGAQGLVIALLVIGVHVLAHAVRRDIEFAYYIGFGAILAALWTELDVLSVRQAEMYSTPLAIYLAGCGMLFSRIRPDRRYPALMDAAVVIVGVGYPLQLALQAGPDEAIVHTAWVIALSLVLIAAGISVKSRWYLFGGSGALAAVALYRSFSALVEVWWLVLFVIGIGLLAIALTWERQRMVVSSTRERLKRSFEEWR